MNILIYCPDAVARAAISNHLIDIGNYQLLFAQSESLLVSLALNNPIHLVLLFNPTHNQSLIDIKDFLRQKRNKMRVRVLPNKKGVLKPGWREVVSEALKPAKLRSSKERRIHPRFSWKPND